MNSIARVFLDVHLGQGFEGLGEMCKKAKINLDLLDDGDFIIFINRKCNAFKLFNSKKYLVYFKHQGRIPLEAIRHLPASFGGSKLEFDKAIEKTLRSKINWDS